MLRAVSNDCFFSLLLLLLLLLLFRPQPMRQAARRRRIPIIYDEVFTGCWRLGPATAGLHMLGGEAPDIACYAKLLTGGVAPLAVTLSSETVFDAFKGDSKVSECVCVVVVHVCRWWGVQWLDQHHGVEMQD